jgi:hypothetical protein
VLAERRGEALPFFGHGEPNLADDLLQAFRLQPVDHIVERLEHRNADVERAGDVLEECEQILSLDLSVGEYGAGSDALPGFTPHLGANEKRTRGTKLIGDNVLVRAR